MSGCGTRPDFAFTRIRSRDEDDELQFVLDTPDIPGPVQRFAVERDAAAIGVIQQELLNAPLAISRVSFTFPAPARADRYTETFGVAPEFGAGENVLALPATSLDLPLPQANEHTAALTQAQCRELMQQRQARTGLSGQVRDLLLARPSQPPSAEEVADHLNMSSRTLRHRLAAEGTSFRELLDEIRQRLAAEMLLSGRLTVARPLNAWATWSSPAFRRHFAGGTAWGHGHTERPGQAPAVSSPKKFAIGASEFGTWRRL